VEYERVRDVAAKNQALLEERFKSIQTGTATIEHDEIIDPDFRVTVTSELMASDSEAEEVEILEKIGATKQQQQVLRNLESEFQKHRKWSRFTP
jgi:hypothetical protein